MQDTSNMKLKPQSGPPKLDPAVKVSWLEALRSGEYEQGRDYLNHDGNFCCLGVLCDLAVKAGVKVEVTGESYFHYDEQSGTPPQSVYNWAFPTLAEPEGGWGEWEPRLPVKSEDGPYLTALNDAGRSFAELADIIEEHL